MRDQTSFGTPKCQCPHSRCRQLALSRHRTSTSWRAERTMTPADISYRLPSVHRPVAAAHTRGPWMTAQKSRLTTLDKRCRYRRTPCRTYNSTNKRQSVDAWTLGHLSATCRSMANTYKHAVCYFVIVISVWRRHQGTSPRWASLYRISPKTREEARFMWRASLRRCLTHRRTDCQSTCRPPMERE